MKTYKLFSMVICATFCAAVFSGCGNNSAEDNNPQNKEISKMEQEFNKFANEYKATFKPLTIDLYTKYFEAAVSGDPDTWAKLAQLEMDMNKIMTDDKKSFKLLKKFNASDEITNPVTKREITAIYNEYLSKQVDTEKLNAMTKLQTEIEQKYNNFRAKVGDKEYSDNEIEDVLSNSTDSKELEAVWLAHKQIGPLVADDVLKLVKMRNEVAVELGFDNYHTMSLTMSDQNPADIEKLFDELDELTRDAFAKLKAEIDDNISKKCGIKAEELMPWHYQNRYFQEAPQIYAVDLDKYYEDVDIEDVTKKYFAGIGLPIEDMVAKSDLYEKPGKNQHAFCIDIDRDAGDIRVLCNIKANNNWMNTNLHEFGHALFEKHLAKDLPWSLKEPAHIFTTEAIAMIFGRFASSPQWMQDNIGMDPEEAASIAVVSAKIRSLEQLVFSRWSQVMYRFEKSMYANPDQDLNKLWWDLAEQYQMIKRPADRNAPDWASKTHIASAPCYYHNYHLGELLASQLYYTISEKVLKQDPTTDMSFSGKPEVGEYLIKNIFAPGAKYYWNDMIEKATGEKLTAKYYAAQFVK
ncbi:MAG: M2 family metallopeptidase [Candidatus Kapabacteria bacterium]|jgi:peptidyl-dipeptidase A|nr:M2 family metallopeptidase [Candidatus Kapabacteria bacterium]